MNKLFVLSAYTTKIKATGWLAPIGLSIGTFLGLIFHSIDIFNVFMCFMIMDLLTGIAASKIRGLPITSNRFRDMYYKWMAYSAVIGVGYGIEAVAGATLIHTAALGWVLLSEAISILENTEVMLNKRIPLLGMIKKLMKKYTNGATNEQKSDDSKSDIVQDD